jgi:hypothetical protein
MWANYAVALLALFTSGAVWYLRRRGEQPMELVDASGVAAEVTLADQGVTSVKGTGETGTGNHDGGGQHD